MTLKIFKESSWMNNTATDKLFDLKDDGTFVARHTGIYLLYAHVSAIYAFVLSFPLIQLHLNILIVLIVFIVISEIK